MEGVMFFTRKSRLRITQTIFAGISVLTMSSSQAQTVISEVLYDAAGTDNGSVFVELYGIPGTSLDGWLLEGVNGSDGGVYRSVDLSGVIPSDGVFLIGDDSGDGSTLISNADLVRDVDFQNGPDSIVLSNGTTVLDALGYGDFSGQVFAGEGNAAVDVQDGRSLARHNVLLDTDNNVNDFMALDVPTPGTALVSAVPVPPAIALFLSGVIGMAGVARKQG
jgi:hypothetical protein